MKPCKPLSERLWPRTIAGANGCVLWTGKPDKQGYGWISTGGRNGRDVPVHRAAYELFHGVIIPPELVARHSCDNPPCVNPYHIEPGTKQDNMDDMYRRNRAVGRGPDKTPRVRRWQKRPEVTA